MWDAEWIGDFEQLVREASRQPYLYGDERKLTISLTMAEALLEILKKGEG